MYWLNCNGHIIDNNVHRLWCFRNVFQSDDIDINNRIFYSIIITWIFKHFACKRYQILNMALIVIWTQNVRFGHIFNVLLHVCHSAKISLGTHQKIDQVPYLLPCTVFTINLPINCGQPLSTYSVYSRIDC